MTATRRVKTLFSLLARKEVGDIRVASAKGDSTGGERGVGTGGVGAAGEEEAGEGEVTVLASEEEGGFAGEGDDAASSRWAALERDGVD